MSTPFINLAVAVQNLLLASPALAGGNVFRDRMPPVQRNLSSAVVIKLDKTQGERASTNGGPTDWGTLFAIECYARCASNALPSEAVDALLQSCFERLAGQGGALGLSVEDILPDPRIEWDLGEGDTPLVCVTFTVQIVHRTQATLLVPWN